MTDTKKFVVRSEPGIKVSPWIMELSVQLGYAVGALHMVAQEPYDLDWDDDD